MNGNSVIAYAAINEENIVGAVIAAQGALPHSMNPPISKREKRKYARQDRKRAKQEAKQLKAASCRTRQSTPEKPVVRKDTPQKSNTSNSFGKTLLVWVFMCMCSFCFGMWFFGNVVSVVTVSGLSMEPTLEDGDYLLVSRYVETVADGDIVIINLSDDPEDTSNMIVKRVIATSGQTVQITPDGTVMVDGVAEPQNFDECCESGCATTPIVVPDGQIFVLGDNRNNSFDSRYMGCISIDQVYGKEILWLGKLSNPLSEFEHPEHLESIFDALQLVSFSTLVVCALT